MCVQLKQSIERHQLEPGAHEQLLLRDARKNLVHHPLRARVAITDRVFEEFSSGVDETVINSPTRNPDALNASAQFLTRSPALQRPVLYLVENFREVPSQVPVTLTRRIMKPPSFLEQ